MAGDTNGNGSVTLPRWFLWIGGVFAAISGCTFLPWSIWITVSVFVANATSPAISENSKAISDLKQQVAIINAARTLDQSAATDIRSDLRAITSMVEEVKRDVAVLKSRGMP